MLFWRKEEGGKALRSQGPREQRVLPEGLGSQPTDEPHPHLERSATTSDAHAFAARAFEIWRIC